VSTSVSLDEPDYGNFHAIGFTESASRFARRCNSYSVQILVGWRSHAV
jgi:hypothetical protein